MRTAGLSTDGIYASVRPSLMSIPFLSGSCAQPIPAEQSTEENYVPMPEPWSNGPDFFDGGYSNAQPITAEQPTEEAVQATSHPLTLYPIEVIPPHSKFQQTSL